MVLHRLDRLTQNEARITAAQILEVVYHLVQNMRVVMDGERVHLGLLPTGCRGSFPLDGKSSVDHVKDTLGMFCGPRLSNCV